MNNNTATGRNAERTAIQRAMRVGKNAAVLGTGVLTLGGIAAAGAQAAYAQPPPRTRQAGVVHKSGAQKAKLSATRVEWQGRTEWQQEDTPPTSDYPDGTIFGRRQEKEVKAVTRTVAGTRWQWNPQGNKDNQPPAPPGQHQGQGKWTNSNARYNGTDPVGEVFQEGKGNGSYFYWEATEEVVSPAYTVYSWRYGELVTPTEDPGTPPGDEDVVKEKDGNVFYDEDDKIIDDNDDEGKIIYGDPYDDEGKIILIDEDSVTVEDAENNAKDPDGTVIPNKGCENCQGNNPAYRCDGSGCAGNGHGAPGGNQGGNQGGGNQGGGNGNQQ